MTKGKKKTTPEMHGFTKHTHSSYLYARPAVLPCAKQYSSWIEIGNLLDRNRKSPEQMLEQPAIATMEICCDADTIFGNPFDAKKLDESNKWIPDESLRDTVCDAYEEFLHCLLHHSSNSDNLLQMASHICKRFELRENLIRTSWRYEFGSLHANEFRNALRELTELVRCRQSADPLQTPGDRTTRLICWCAPNRCHIEALAKHIDRCIDMEALQSVMAGSAEGAPRTTTSTSAAAWLDAGAGCDASWIAVASDGRTIGKRTSDSSQTPSPPPHPSLPPPPPPPPPRSSDDTQQTPPRSGKNCRWDPLGAMASTPPAQRRRKPSRASSRNGRQRPPWGDYWGAAGVVALRGRGSCRHICLVQKRNGRLGFPKGRAEHPDDSPLATAYREWSEESMLPREHLSLLELQPLVDGWGCHYFFAEWETHGYALELDETQTWEVQDDPLDNDPIVCAHWMPCRQALAHEMLSQDRKHILRQALQVLPLTENSTTNCKSNDDEINTVPASKKQSQRWRNKITPANP